MKKNIFRDCVVICREYNRQKAEIEVTVIEKDVTDSLIRQLVRLSMQETHYRYFLVRRRDYQKNKHSIIHQVRVMDIKNKKMIMEFGRAAMKSANENT